MNNVNRRWLLTAAGTAALTACAPQAQQPTATTSASVATDPSSLGEVTLKVMDTWVDQSSLLGQWMKKVQANFTATYPNITITRSTATFDEIQKTLKLKLSDNTAPDVVPANNGWQGIGTYAKAGLILNLDTYAQHYGWNDRISKTIAIQHQATPDGSAIGRGSWYGVPMAQGAFIAVYYNRALLTKHGLGVPATFEEFDSALATIKAKGDLPLQLGTQDQWLSTTALFALMDVYGDAAKINAFVYGTEDVAAADTGLMEAAETFQRWSTSGYFPANFAGIPGGDAGQAFVDGTGVFTFSYSDSLPFSTTAKANEFGSFLLPTTTGKAQGTGASQQNFSIAANSKNPAAAAAFLDHLCSKEAGQVAVELGIMPFLGEFEAPSDAGALLKDEVAQLNAVTADDGFIPYFDWASPTMLDTLGGEGQKLLASKATPTDIVTSCQKDYDAFKKLQGK